MVSLEDDQEDLNRSEASDPNLKDSSGEDMEEDISYSPLDHNLSAASIGNLNPSCPSATQDTSLNNEEVIISEVQDVDCKHIDFTSTSGMIKNKDLVTKKDKEGSKLPPCHYEVKAVACNKMPSDLNNKDEVIPATNTFMEPLLEKLNFPDLQLPAHRTLKKCKSFDMGMKSRCLRQTSIAELFKHKKIKFCDSCISSSWPGTTRKRHQDDHLYECSKVRVVNQSATSSDKNGQNRDMRQQSLKLSEIITGNARNDNKPPEVSQSQCVPHLDQENQSTFAEVGAGIFNEQNKIMNSLISQEYKKESSTNIASISQRPISQSLAQISHTTSSNVTRSPHVVVPEICFGYDPDSHKLQQNISTHYQQEELLVSTPSTTNHQTFSSSSSMSIMSLPQSICSVSKSEEETIEILYMSSAMTSKTEYSSVYPVTSFTQKHESASGTSFPPEELNPASFPSDDSLLQHKSLSVYNLPTSLPFLKSISSAVVHTVTSDDHLADADMLTKSCHIPYPIKSLSMSCNMDQIFPENSQSLRGELLQTTCQLTSRELPTKSDPQKGEILDVISKQNHPLLQLQLKLDKVAPVKYAYQEMPTSPELVFEADEDEDHQSHSEHVVPYQKILTKDVNTVEIVEGFTKSEYDTEVISNSHSKCVTDVSTTEKAGSQHLSNAINMHTDSPNSKPKSEIFSTGFISKQWQENANNDNAIFSQKTLPENLCHVPASSHGLFQVSPELPQSITSETVPGERTVPELGDVEDDRLQEVSLYSIPELDQTVSDASVIKEFKDKPSHSFQWHSVYDSPFNKPCEDQGSLSSLHPMSYLQHSHRPMRVGLSRKQRVKSLHRQHFQ